MLRTLRVLALVAVAGLGAVSVASARLEVRVFARVPAPGYPANAVVAPDGTVYAGTFKSFSSPSASGPSKVFAFSASGTLLRTYVVSGQTPGAPDAVQVAALDRAGDVYLLDQDPARVVKLDPKTGRQTTWATFASLPGANPPEPDFAAWGPDGSLYVTDYNQFLVWRVPPGGGPAGVWLTDPRLNGIVVGPAGIELMADAHTLMLSTGAGGTNPLTGKLYTVPIQAGGKPGALHQLWESGPAEAPDGFAIARSGDVYLALVGPTGNAVVEISPSGQLLARVPAGAADNAALAVPFDAPGSVAFLGDSLIVANGASISNDSSHWALLQIAAGEPGLPVSLPPAGVVRGSVRYRLQVTPRHPHAGRRVRFRFVAVAVAGAGMGGRQRPVAGARVRFAGRVVRTGRRGRASLRAVLRGGRRRYRATLLLHGRGVATAFVTTR